MVFSKLPSFMRVPKYKTFSLTPRYYNPVQEEKEKRLARIKAKLERENLGKSTESHEHIRIKDFYRQKKSTSRVQRQSSARVLLIFIVLVLIVYIIFR